MIPAELKTILEKHSAWTRDEDHGARANLSGADLSYANLSRANLSYANLSSADLSGANLSRANLSGADLSYANLSYANLSSANLSGADLSYANLSSANLSHANLSSANLSHATMQGRKVANGSAVLVLSFDHGWVLLLIRLTDGIGVRCGCRWFDDPKSARRHWNGHGNEQRRRIVIPALDALLTIAKAQGWEIQEKA